MVGTCERASEVRNGSSRTAQGILNKVPRVLVGDALLFDEMQESALMSHSCCAWQRALRNGSSFVMCLAGPLRGY